MGTLISIAISLGLGMALSAIDNWQTKKKETKLRESEIPQAKNLVDAMINEARSKGQSVVNKLYDQLQNTYFVGPAGSNLKQYISKVRGKVQKRYEAATKKNEELQRDVDKLQNLSSSFDQASDDYKLSDSGKNELNEIKTKAAGLGSKISEIQGVDKYV